MIHSDEIRTILDLLPDIRDGRVYDRVHHLLRDIVIKLEEQEMLQKDQMKHLKVYESIQRIYDAALYHYARDKQIVDNKKPAQSGLLYIHYLIIGLQRLLYRNSCQ